MLTYSRAEAKTKKWDVVADGMRHTYFVTLTIRENGAIVGTARTSTTWTTGASLRGRRWQSRKWRNDWELEIRGRRWTLPGLRLRSEVLAEIKLFLQK